MTIKYLDHGAIDDQSSAHEDGPYRCWRSGVCCQVDKTVSLVELEQMKAAGPMYSELVIEPSGDIHEELVTVKGPCPWYKNMCTIYSARPAVCFGYICYRKQADEAFRSMTEQVEFFQNNPDAREQAKKLKREAMVIAKSRGWHWLKVDDDGNSL